MSKTVKFLLPVVIIAMSMFSFVSCYEGGGDDPILSSDGTLKSVSTEIYAGQSTLVGTLTISNDDNNLYVKYDITAEGVTINTVHVWAGTDLATVPMTNDGTPIPGQFPYKAEEVNATTYTVTIPFSAIGVVNVDEYCGAEIFVLAHAALSNGETAWSNGTSFESWTGTKRWGWYTTYVIDCDEGDPTPDLTPETAFAKGNWVFASSSQANPEGLPSLGLTQSRWGWAINITADGSYAYDIYAGAGLNKVENGTKVGTLTLDVAAGTVTATCAMLPGFFMGEAHVYAGDVRPDTIAPGQYGNTVYFDPMATSATASYDVADLDGDGIWIIAHAVVFGNYPENE